MTEQQVKELKELLKDFYQATFTRHRSESLGDNWIELDEAIEAIKKLKEEDDRTTS